VIRDKPRWNKCVEYLNERLGLATGAMFVHEKFRKESKDVVCDLVFTFWGFYLVLLKIALINSKQAVIILGQSELF
jgi:predicted metalloendopeptidase